MAIGIPLSGLRTCSFPSGAGRELNPGEPDFPRRRRAKLRAVHLPATFGGHSRPSPARDPSVSLSESIAHLPLSVSGLVHFPQAPGASLIIWLRRRRARFAWLRAYARGAVAPSGLLRSPVPVTGDALPVGVRDPHHGAVEGVGGAGQHRGMQNETQETTTAATVGRSSIKRLPPELREAVDAAIADGATIDEITALIRGEGGACSRSAVGRYTKNVRDLIRQQQETDRGIEMWVRALGERPEGRAGLILIETLRTMTLSTLAELSKREEPADAGRALPSLARSQAHRRHRQAPYRAGARGGQGGGEGGGQGRARRGPGAGQAPVRKGLSPEAVAAIREVVEGRPPARARRHIGAGRPLESCGIPLNPT